MRASRSLELVEATGVKDVSESQCALADVVILDARASTASFLELCHSLLSSNKDLKIIVVSRATHAYAVLAALGAGAVGYALEDIDPQGLQCAAKWVRDGGMFVDPRVVPQLLALATGRRVDIPFGLTHMEALVVSFLPDGLTNDEIARVLKVSRETVKSHLRSAMRKMKVKDRAEAGALAVRQRLS